MTMGTTVSVVSVRDLKTGLVEVIFGLPDGTRQRVVLPYRHAGMASVEYVGRGLEILQAIERRAA